MFKNLLQFWKGKDFLSQVFEDFRNMLDDTEGMFNSVCRRLIDSEEQPNLKDKIYQIDSKVNEFQKDIRKRIIEHLTIQPSVDVSTCLLLMSVVKDAERLGDYAKNLLEVSDLLDQPIDKNKYRSLFDNLEEKVMTLFKQTKEAFIESNEDKAAKSWDYQKEIKARCDGIIEKVAKSNMSANEAVCFALIARYFKRTASHLTNIATSVILPLTDLDFFDERRKDE